MGIDDWDTMKARRIDEPRLASLLHVDGFREPPYYDRRENTGGIPARIFPEFLVCPRCNRLARYRAFELRAGEQEFLCKAANCGGAGRAPAYPARFMVACARGHLSDFPWHEYVHQGPTDCVEELRFEDIGMTGSITDLFVRCPTHDKRRNFGQAFGRAGRSQLPACKGERPWLRDVDSRRCDKPLHVLLRGASNAYFPIVASALSIPPWSDPIQLALAPYIEQLEVGSVEEMTAWRKFTNDPEIQRFAPQQLWDAYTLRKNARAGIADLLSAEWNVLSGPPAVKVDDRAEFQSREVPWTIPAPHGLRRLVLVDRLREVRALRGLSRIDAVPDVGDLGEVEAIDAGMAPIHRAPTRWLPGVELRGEGVFLQFSEDIVGRWEASVEVTARGEDLRRREAKWSEQHNMPTANAHSLRYVFLHSFAHLLVRQLALDCGYSSASLRERIYADAANQMAGVLVYTASADSEGSLGGLIESSRPDAIVPSIERALEAARLCPNDPLCADRFAGTLGEDLNGAACHACLLISETACESNNRFLDRAAVLPTLSLKSLAFFQ